MFRSPRTHAHAQIDASALQQEALERFAPAYAVVRPTDLSKAAESVPLHATLPIIPRRSGRREGNPKPAGAVLAAQSRAERSISTSASFEAASNWLETSHIGTCGKPAAVSTAADPANCLRGTSGSFPGFARHVGHGWKTAALACLQLCNSCVGCRFISLSLKSGDCSWFSECRLSELDISVAGCRSGGCRSGLAIRPAPALSLQSRPCETAHGGCREVALVISETFRRFSRVASLLAKDDVAAIHIPAVFVGNGPNCQGTNGHRLAFRNAWALIAKTNTSMYVFEDDVEKVTFFDPLDIPTQSDVHFVGWCGGGFWCNHAAWYSPRAAAYLLSETTTCSHPKNGTLMWGSGIDYIVSSECGQRRWGQRTELTSHGRYLRCSRTRNSVFRQNQSLGTYHTMVRKQGLTLKTRSAAAPVGDQDGMFVVNE